MRQIATRVGTELLRRDVTRYLIAGGFNTGLTFIIYVSGVRLGLPYIVANVIAWCVGVVVSFCLSATFVFRRGMGLGRFGKFLVSNLINLGISTGLLTIFVKCLALDPVLASLMNIPIVVVLNFLAGKFIVFGEKKS